MWLGAGCFDAWDIFTGRNIGHLSLSISTHLPTLAEAKHEGQPNELPDQVLLSTCDSGSEPAREDEDVQQAMLMQAGADQEAIVQAQATATQRGEEIHGQSGSFMFAELYMHEARHTSECARRACTATLEAAATTC